MQNISIILVTLTTFTTRGQTENEKMGSDMSISSEVPDFTHGISRCAKDELKQALCHHGVGKIYDTNELKITRVIPSAYI